MKKSLTAIAVAALISAPVLVQADEGPTVFGRVHMAVEKVGKDELMLDYSQPRSNELGVRGNVDTNLMGMKAIYQLDIGLDNEMTAGNLFYVRDTFVGLSSKEYGTARAGTMDTHYKDTAKPMDPFLGTALEGRKAGTGTRTNGSINCAKSACANNAGLNIMSRVHANGAGDDGNLQQHTLRYDSPAISGAKVSAVYGLAQSTAGNGANNYAIGIDYNEGPIFAFLDFASYGNLNTNVAGVPTNTMDDATATKIGGKYTMGDMSFGLQYEIDGGAISNYLDPADTTKTKYIAGKQNMLFAVGTYAMGATTIAVTAGMASDSGKATCGTTKKADCVDGNTSFAIGVKHALAKKTTAYVGYGMILNGDDAFNGNVAAAGESSSLFTVGMIQAF